MSVRFAAFIPDADNFDASLFRWGGTTNWNATPNASCFTLKRRCMRSHRPGQTTVELTLAPSPHFWCCCCRLSHSEAACMDPQARILLEQVHLALSNAGGSTAHAMPPDTGV